MNTPVLNADPKELAKFNTAANKWWDTSGEFKPLHDMNPLRTNFIDERSPVAETQVIDIGCGGGILAEGLAQRGARVKGIDLGEAPLQVAKLHALESGLEIDYENISAEAIAERDAGQYDIVTCLEMLEHVPDPASIIKACADLCKPGGHLYFSTINRGLKAYALGIVAAEYVLNLLPKGTHDYQKLIKPSELARWCRNANLEVISLQGMIYNPLTKTFKLSQRDLDINYIVHVKKP